MHNVAFGASATVDAKPADSNSPDTIDDSDVEFASKEGKDDKAYLRNTDAGFNMGVGYKVGGIQAQLGYGLGLSNLIRNDVNDKKPDITVRNRGFQLALSYFFQ